jgi:hypothetical protein
MEKYQSRIDKHMYVRLVKGKNSEWFNLYDTPHYIAIKIYSKIAAEK